MTAQESQLLECMLQGESLGGGRKMTDKKKEKSIVKRYQFQTLTILAFLLEMQSDYTSQLFTIVCIVAFRQFKVYLLEAFHPVASKIP